MLNKKQLNVLFNTSRDKILIEDPPTFSIDFSGIVSGKRRYTLGGPITLGQFVRSFLGGCVF